MMGNSDYIFGIRPVIEAIIAGKEIEKVLVKKGLMGLHSDELTSMLRNHGIPFQLVPVERLNRVTHKNHQGVVAFVAHVVYQKLDSIIPFIFEQGRNPLILVLDHITDVRNFGAVCRTAECAGIDAVVIPEHGAAQINADAVKTSSGALHNLNVCRAKNLKDSIKFLKDSGLFIIAASEKAMDSYLEADLTMPLAIIMGSEETGISPEIMKLADAVVKIPVLGAIQSLNVSASAAVLLYEALRQRGEKSM
ncbi:MAG: 23S rRNA (guanosine(2251)-2'-O)-methyltransferase RlmB [Bacteroidia bacterium]|nr:23S rRNA (guanosine(2251)-2'-O)-methyltransferase RlmB [Bacteroidia bacterium]